MGGEDPGLVRFQKVLSESSAGGGRRRCTFFSKEVLHEEELLDFKHRQHLFVTRGGVITC